MTTNIENIPALVLFSRIVQQGSMSKAALSFGLGRSAVSKQLRALEEKLGVRLLHRSTRKLTLTDAGEQILHKANEIAESWQSIQVLSEELQGGVRGKLKVTCSAALGRFHLMPLLPLFSEQYPELHVQLLLEDRFSDLIAEQIDIAIRVGHLPSSSLVARRLGEMNWAVVASPRYLQKHGEPQTPQQLINHQCLYYQNSTFTANSWVFIGVQGEEQITVSGPLSVNDATALVQAAVDGMGILLIDRNMLGEHLEKGRLVTLLHNYKHAEGFPVYALYPARNQLPSKTRYFLDFLSKHLSPKLE